MCWELCGEVVGRACRGAHRPGARRSEVIARSSPGRKRPALGASHSPVYRKCRTRVEGSQEAGRWRQRGGWGGWRGEKGVNRAGWRFPDSPWNNKTRCGAVRNARSAAAAAVVLVGQECQQYVLLFIQHSLHCVVCKPHFRQYYITRLSPYCVLSVLGCIEMSYKRHSTHKNVVFLFLFFIYLTLGLYQRAVVIYISWLTLY